MLSPAIKDLQPALQKSSVIYEYKCHCGSRYIGRTSLQLRDRIKQHVTKWQTEYYTSSQRLHPNRAGKEKQTSPECDSAIGQHLLESSQCAANYPELQFSVLDTKHSRFHCSLLEAIYITTCIPSFAYKKSSFTFLTCLNRTEVRVKLPHWTVRHLRIFFIG